MCGRGRSVRQRDKNSAWHAVSTKQTFLTIKGKPFYTNVPLTSQQLNGVAYHFLCFSDE